MYFCLIMQMWWGSVLTYVFLPHYANEVGQCLKASTSAYWLVSISLYLASLLRPSRVKPTTIL